MKHIKPSADDVKFILQRNDLVEITELNLIKLEYQLSVELACFGLQMLSMRLSLQALPKEKREFILASERGYSNKKTN
ncbi:hypothetical protein H5410_048808 [Solanum commersonii]|uniref:Uncharacterized protein n=1 Tax=Solanum commersonii TaxID=4109 RepID=A0A9J5XMU3_SOLCO|nr:hypothetical protein H5410_048808 [Solanum commersonii]